MTRAAIRFYASDYDKAGFEDSLRDGIVLGAEGVINLLWEDFSAVEAASDAGLEGVVWDAVRDHTPGSLTVTVQYALTPTQVARRLAGQGWIDGHWFEPPLTLHTYG